MLIVGSALPALLSIPGSDIAPDSLLLLELNQSVFHSDFLLVTK
jgi:hypothetical protein